MKILHILAQLPSRTGSGVYFGNLIEELGAHSHDQRAVFAVQDGFAFAGLPAGAQYPVEFKTPALPFPIAGMSDVMPYENTVYSSMTEPMLAAWRRGFAAALGRANAEFCPDVVLLHHLWMLTSMACELFPAALKIGVCHNTDIRQAEQHPSMREKYVTNLGALDAVFSLSDTQKGKIADVFAIDPAKIITVGGGFNQNIFFPAPQKARSERVEIVFSAKIERSKGVFELARAFSELNKIKPRTRLYIIGTPNEENAAKLAAIAGDCPDISLVRISNQREMADFIREKDIFVMPSFYEGLGLMAIESLACGLRVVSTEIEALMALLGGDINGSGAIEYVKLPRVFDVDKPVEQDLPRFRADLLAALLTQVERVEAGEGFPARVLSAVSAHSWSGVAARVNDIIHRLSSRP